MDVREMVRQPRASCEHPVNLGLSYRRLHLSLGESATHRQDREVTVAISADQPGQVRNPAGCQPHVRGSKADERDIGAHPNDAQLAFEPPVGQERKAARWLLPSSLVGFRSLDPSPPSGSLIARNGESTKRNYSPTAQRSS